MKKILIIGTCAIVLLGVVFAFPGSSLAEDDFLIGLIPEENIFRAIQKHRPLEAYLSDKLGVKVKFTILSRYGDIVDRFTSRDMDGAFFGIYTSALASDKLNVEPIVRQMHYDGSTTSKGVLIARKDSGISTLNDMKGRRATFVDRATATGHIFVIAHLKENGIRDTEGFFSEYSFTGSHESVIFAVLDGRADVGAVKREVLDRLVAKDPMIGEELQVLAESPSLPDHTLMIRKDLPPDFKQTLKDTLLKLDRTPEGLEILETMGIQRFIDASGEDFAEVRSLAEKAGMTREE